MATILIDTSIWISFFSHSRREYVQGVQAQVKDWLASETIAASGIVIAEFLQGLTPEEEDRYLPTLSRLPYLEISREECERAGRMNRDLLKQGQGLALTDCLIAATAITHDCTLATADRHFERFPGLKLLLLE